MKLTCWNSATMSETAEANRQPEESQWIWSTVTGKHQGHSHALKIIRHAQRGTAREQPWSRRHGDENCWKMAPMM